LLLGKIIDILTKMPHDYAILIQFLIGVALIEVFSPTIRLKSKYHLGRIGEKIAKDVRLKGLAKVLELDMAWHEETMSGSVMEKISNGAKTVRGLLKFLRENGYSIVIQLSGILFVFGYLHIKYLFVLLATIVAYLWVEYYHDKIINQKRNKESIMREKLSGRTYEFAHNIRTVKSLGLERAIKARTVKAEQILFEISNEVGLINNGKWRYMQTVAAFFKMVFLVIVCVDVLKGNLSAGMVLVYVTYFQQVHSVLNDISDSIDSVIENKNWSLSSHDNT